MSTSPSVGGCPQHPQSQPWPHADGVRCSLCGYFFDGRTPPTPEPAVIRSFARYNELAGRTDQNLPVEYYAGGLAEEAGEIWRLHKRAQWHGHPEATRDAKLDEIGDALWLLARLATRWGVSLEEAAAFNIEKLRRRYPDGFDPARSQNRAERSQNRDIPAMGAPLAPPHAYAWMVRGARGLVRRLEVEILALRWMPSMWVCDVRYENGDLGIEAACQIVVAKSEREVFIEALEAGGLR